MNPFDSKDPKLLYELAKDDRFGDVTRLSFLIEAYTLEIKSPISSPELVCLRKRQLDAAQKLLAAYFSTPVIDEIVKVFNVFSDTEECKKVADVFIYGCGYVEELFEPPSNDYILSVGTIKELPG